MAKRIRKAAGGGGSTPAPERVGFALGVVCGALGLDADEMLARKAGAPEIEGLVAGRIEALKAERSEADVALQRVVVRLGEKDYEVRVRPLGQDREWRQKVMDVVSPYMSEVMPLLVDAVGRSKAGAGGSKKGAGGSVDGVVVAVPQEVLARLLPKLWVDGIDELADLFFGYAPELDRAEIEAVASPEQVMRAAMQVFRVFVLPFVLSLYREMAGLAGDLGLGVGSR